MFRGLASTVERVVLPIRVFDLHLFFLRSDVPLTRTRQPAVFSSPYVNPYFLLDFIGDNPLLIRRALVSEGLDLVIC